MPVRKTLTNTYTGETLLELALAGPENLDEPNTAFSGEKLSGLGRFGGRWALEEFTTEHWVSVQHEARAYLL
jgi:acyl-CoA reductase-like NAD-dependent aldehyde dehydrogenase